MVENMFKITTVLISALLLMSGCTVFEEMQKDWINRNCNPNGAFNAGLTDGMSAGKMPNRYFADACPVDHEYLNSLYLKGFSKGLKSRPTEINVNNKS